jgi:hypothetical protein
MVVFWVIALAIALIMEAASISETSVNFYESTWRYNPDDSHRRSSANIINSMKNERGNKYENPQIFHTLSTDFTSKV